jgi:predicted nucleotidyltransferase
MMLDDNTRLIPNLNCFKLDLQRVIVFMEFGSRLYGTATPESDSDFKGVFMPSSDEILLGNAQNSLHGNVSDGSATDTELYSLHYFIKLACQGQTVAFDMLHAPPQNLLANSPVWLEIISNRHKFYSKKMNAFTGYAKQQAMKYGEKGDRLRTIREICDLLRGIQPDQRFGILEKKIGNMKHVHVDFNRNGVMEFDICGKKIQETIYRDEACKILQYMIDQYGDRAKSAADNNGIDWKAVSHAVRVMLEVKQLFAEKTITFPLRDAQLITDIKSGRYDYPKVESIITGLFSEVELLAGASGLPDEVDRNFWNNFIIETCKKYLIATKWGENVDNTV